MRRAGIFVLLIVCIALAGCSGIQTTTTATETTPTETGTQSAVTPQESAENSRFEIGERVSPARLREGHTEAMADIRYTIEHVRNTRIRVPGDSSGLPIEEIDVSRTHVVTADREYGYQEQAAVVRRTVRPRTKNTPTGASVLEHVGLALTVTEVIERDGHTRYVLKTDVNSSTETDSQPYVRIVTDDRGLMYTAFVGTVHDGEIEIQSGFSLDAAGQSVRPPAWTADLQGQHVSERDDIGTVVVNHTGLDTRLTVTTTVDSLDGITLERNEEPFLHNEDVPDWRVTPIVDPNVDGPIENATVTMQYNESELPNGADEGNLSLFVFNWTLQTYLPLNTTVDEQNNTVTATEGPPVTFTEGGGPEQTLQPQIAAPGVKTPITTLHVPTYLELFRRN
ncbi:hypothetical protein [Halorhabdus sp. CUG00001]|uniref:hypothetical protein n=1 Tax=Halorhabdus sp. CUG00001 TaxID=2600297 RepID=UPI00131AF79D|nr:hypothetical protein [Halorhabdus sp. CUG00001]